MMDATSTINTLLLSPIPEVRDLAKTTKYYADQLEAGKISKSEFDELIDDMAQLDGIHQSMVTLEVWREINIAVQTLIKLKDVISFL